MPDYLVWNNLPWWQNSRGIWLPQDAQASDKHAGWVSFYATPEKRQQRVRTHAKPGRYLKRYFSDVLTDKQIKYYAEWQMRGAVPDVTGYTEEDGYKLKFATTPARIVRVYHDSRITSCMDRHHFKKDENPTRVYGAGDLAVAYLEHEDTGDIPARVLVWRKKKHASRVYPTEGKWCEDGFASMAESCAAADALRSRLTAKGFGFAATEGNRLIGAKLLKIPHPCDPGGGVYYMPYIDGDYSAVDEGDHFRLAEGDTPGAYMTGATEGYISDNDRAPEEPEATCDRCGEELDPHDSYSVYTDERNDRLRCVQEWCADCASDHAICCQGFNEWFSSADVDHVEIDDEIYTMAYVRQHDGYESDLTGDWFFGDEDPRVELPDGGVCSTSEKERGLADSTFVSDDKQEELTC